MENNIIKFIYCLHIGSSNKFDKIVYYAKYTTLTDKRTLKLAFGKFLVEESDDAIKKLLKYLVHQDYYQNLAKKRWEAIRDKIGGSEQW